MKLHDGLEASQYRRWLDDELSSCLCCGWYLQCGEVMGADGHERALPAEVLVQLVLQIDEAGIARLVQAEASQHRTGHERPHQGRLRLDHHP